MKRILVTGAQGFLGRYLVHHLLDENSTCEILGIGRSPTYAKHFTHRVTWLGQPLLAPIPARLGESDWVRYHYQRLDVCDREKLVDLLKDFQPEWVFHLASGLRDDEPCDLCRTNVEGATALTQGLIDAACRPEMVVYGSSGGVYGRPRRLPLDEETPTQPNDIYGSTKLAGEYVTRVLTRDYDVPALWARLFNLVGPGQDERHACGYFASRIAAIAVGEASPELTVGELQPTRDFIDVRDAASALVQLARHGIAGLAYNVGSGIEITIGEVLATLLRLAGVEAQVVIGHGQTRKADIPRHFADINRLRALGFEPSFTLVQSLRDLLDYYVDVVSPRRDSHAERLCSHDINVR